MSESESESESEKKIRVHKAIKCSIARRRKGKKNRKKKTRSFLSKSMSMEVSCRHWEEGIMEAKTKKKGVNQVAIDIVFVAGDDRLQSAPFLNNE